jgi:predicted CoA-substrate-specific enzyme activase
MREGINMKFGGIDIGSLTGKTVIIEDSKIISSKIIEVKRNPILTATRVYEDALNHINLKPSDIDFCVGTGYGREKIPFAMKTISEISCHGKGAYILDSSIRTIIDIGGQDCKIIILDNKGDLADFVMNEKCAAGTGRYLEIMAKLLNLSLDELGTISLKSKSAVFMSSMCSIYAQTEVLKYISKKAKKEDIAAGINKSMAERVLLMTKKLRMQANYTMSGGVAKNRGVVENLEKMLNIKFLQLPIDSQLIGALGAAYFAQEYYNKSRSS